MVDALTVAEAKYKAALNVSAVVAARTTPVPKLWWPTSSSPLKLVQRACVLAMIVPFLGYTQFKFLILPFCSIF